MILEVRDLRAGRVVRGVSFAVGRGRIHALLGRPGTGKTTVLEALAGRRPFRGAVRLAAPAALWSDPGLFPGLTVAEIVDTWRRWTLDPLTRAEALALVGLGGVSWTRFEQLRPGQRRRLDLALALLSGRGVLLLDEPALGLDAAARADLWECLRSLAASGVTVVLATRDPADAALGDSVTLLDRPRLRAAA